MENIQIRLHDQQMAELEPILQLLKNRAQVEAIICFGVLYSHTNNHTCFLIPYTETENFYYLLVIIADDTLAGYKIQDLINNKYKTSVFLIVHELKAVTEAISQKDRFFVNTLRNGTFLHTSKSHSIPAEIVLGGIGQRMVKDQNAFKHIYHLAHGFYECATDSYEKGHYHHVLFLLHQATEQACRGLIRLYTGYRSEMHSLSSLLTFCNCFSYDPSILFGRYFKEDKRLFNLLANSDSKVRYTDSYTVTDHDADRLCTLIKTFLDLTLQLSLKNRT
ncbi:HEPN domain-containing protein [Mucilaginibacter sp. NFX135]|uniref:HEPN domain-containing protein n=1 Tax=Mucilaginibacter sp. NFX135 TaxID=3402687 RepID=UPI003AFB5344